MSAGMPHTPLGSGLHGGTDFALAFADNVDEGLTIERQHDCPAQLGVFKRRHRAVYDRSTAGIPTRDLAAHLRCLVLDLLQQRYRHEARSGTIELVGAEGQDPGRGVANDRVLYAVEIRPAWLPIIGVAGQLDRLVRLEFDEFERARADRVLPHLAWRHVARVDRRPTRRQQPDERRLRPLQGEAGLEVA